MNNIGDYEIYEGSYLSNYGKPYIIITTGEDRTPYFEYIIKIIKSNTLENSVISRTVRYQESAFHVLEKEYEDLKRENLLLKHAFIAAKHEFYFQFEHQLEFGISDISFNKINILDLLPLENKYKILNIVNNNTSSDILKNHINSLLVAANYIVFE